MVDPVSAQPQQIPIDPPPIDPTSIEPAPTDPISAAPLSIQTSAEADASQPQLAEPAASSQAELDDLDLELSKATYDPLEGFNRISFKVSMAIDKIIIRPAAMAYREVVPKPLRDGAHNALSNLGEPLVFLNDFLQLRPKRALRTLGRFLINSTLGLAGLFDIAKRPPFNLPHHANSFGDTLGYYGVKPGPFIYVPILGPTTVRDTLGGVDGMIPGKIVGGFMNNSTYINTTTVVDGLDQRERNDDDLKTMLSGAIDPYATFRTNFLQDRAGEIEALKAHDRKAQAANVEETSDTPASEAAAVVPEAVPVP